jgi:transcriptional regulator with XRE-family HTH domain
MLIAMPGSPVVRRRRLAAELRALREARGKGGEVVAAALKWSPSKISRYELAKTGLKPRDVAKLLDYYEVTGPRRAFLLGLADEAAQKGWWEDFAEDLSPDYQQFIGLEHEAAAMAIWYVEAVPGLLQTEAYARHIISGYNQVDPIAPGMVERLVRIRMRRQQILAREPAPLMSVVLDESVLRRRVGGPEIMHEQLSRLAIETERPQVTLRILPLEAQHTVFGASFTIFSFGTRDDAVLHDVVSTEQLTTAFSVEGERDTYLYTIAFQQLVAAALDPVSSRALILDTAESQRYEASGGR